MMPGRFPLSLYRGDSYRWRVVIWLDRLRTYPFDLTGVTPKAEIRAEPGALKWHQITCTVMLPNTIELFLSAFTCRDLPDACVWDLQLTDATNQVATILRGDVRVTADVTDSRTVNVPDQGLPVVGLTAFPKRGAR